MDEKAIKEMCKWIVDHGNRPLTQVQKEMIKATIEIAKTPQELIGAVIASGLWG